MKRRSIKCLVQSQAANAGLRVQPFQLWSSDRIKAKNICYPTCTTEGWHMDTSRTKYGDEILKEKRLTRLLNKFYSENTELENTSLRRLRLLNINK